jgi:hypothetical protein
LLPVLATALLILMATTTPRHILVRLLSLPAISWIGKISYSLYLWHWAVIVAMKWTIGVDTLPLRILAAAIILLLSIASYCLVENAARHATWLIRLSTPSFYGGAAVAFAMVAGAGIGAYLYKPALSLSATAQVDLWDPMQPYLDGRCGRQRQVASFAGGLQLTYLPSSCPEAGQRLFVLGDSHAGAYNRMLERLAADEGYRIVNYTFGGCKLIDAFDPAPIMGCPEFREQALKAISNAATEGDTVFFVGHFTRRYRDAWHLPILETGAISTPSTETLHAEMEDVERLVEPMLQKGIRVVIEGPKPISTTALFRCADWFTQQNSYCAIDASARRDDLVARSAALASFQLELAQQTGVTTWLPFEILCPEDQDKCPTYQQDNPLYYDTDHLSGYSNDVLLPDFRRLLAQ